MILHYVLEKMQTYDEKFGIVPGLPPTVSKVSEDSLEDSPFIDAIAVQELPRKFAIPKMEKFKRATGPEDHVSHYKQVMTCASIPIIVSHNTDF